MRSMPCAAPSSISISFRRAPAPSSSCRWRSDSFSWRCTISAGYDANGRGTGDVAGMELMKDRARWIGDMATVAGIAALFGAVYLLPPDTSLAQVKQAGALRTCVPTLYPPLVTGKADLPGFDMEFAQAIAKRLDVRFVANTN